ncbi:MAG: 2'-5' RNA ligase family protein [Bacteroidia bacterium]|nr:2'-5' RNA ligase family protein [Bacteroidia bacterium]
MSQLNLFVQAEEKKTYEYFVLASPDMNICSKVKNEKLKLHNEIGLNRENLYSAPHISLFKLQNFSAEDRILPLVEKALVNVKSFAIEINSLVVFDHGEKKSIALDFKNPDPICEINNKILDQLLLKPNPFRPHLTIARSVPNKDFRKIKDLKSYVLNGSFLCDNITILRKEMGSKQKYEVFAKIWLN